MADASPEFYLFRWLRWCWEACELAQAAEKSSDRARHLVQARQALRNAREWRGRMEGAG